MSRETFLFRSLMPVSAEALYQWHLRPGAFQRLTPPWERVRIVSGGEVAEGSEVTLQTRVGPLWLSWVAHHEGLQPGREFSDRQLRGPFQFWLHRHSFTPVSHHHSWLSDEIQYQLPGGKLGHILAGSRIKQKLDRMFLHRHTTTSADLTRHLAYPDFQQRHWWITGSSGLIGTQLVPFLTTGGHSITRILRTPSSHGTNPQVQNTTWNPGKQEFHPTHLQAPDVVLHLGGDNLAQGRWTASRKQQIRDSRVESTRFLAEQLARMQKRPAVWICASAIGIYGNSGDTLMNESGAQGNDFLASVCREWEEATAPARDAGIRVVHMRLGVVLSPAGGALAKMLPAFKMGAGGRIGSGNQYLSWVSIEDVLGAILHMAATPSVEGPVNLVAPNPVRQYDFARQLANVLHRPSFMPLPAAAARLLFGEMADATLLGSLRVEPGRLMESGFTFRHPRLEDALNNLLG